MEEEGCKARDSYEGRIIHGILLLTSISHPLFPNRPTLTTNRLTCHTQLTIIK
jgi:hypothetical protein